MMPPPCDNPLAGISFCKPLNTAIDIRLFNMRNYLDDTNENSVGLNPEGV